MSLSVNLDSLKAAASRGDPDAKATLGKYLIAKPTSLQSLEDGKMFLKEALEAGNGEAAEFIAVVHAAGIGCHQDWTKALDYLEQAARLGRDSAARQLAVFADTKDAAPSDMNALRKQIHLEALFSLPEKQILCEAPRIRKVENFIPHRFCDWMIERARPNLGRARTYDAMVAEGRESANRTNSAKSFGLLELDLILLFIQTRISKLTEMPLFLMENASVLHYEVGQQFREHYDYLDPNKPAHAADIRQSGQRLVTCLVYLNEDFEGAETAFPKINQKFRCKKGGALLFANVDTQGQPDPMTRHAGLPPISGEKWLFSQWIRTGPPPQNA